MRYFERGLARHHQKLGMVSGRLQHPRARVQAMGDKLSYISQAMLRHREKILPHRVERVEKLSRLLESYSFERVLDRGFIVARDEAGHIVTDAALLQNDQSVTLQFRAKKQRTAKITG